MVNEGGNADNKNSGNDTEYEIKRITGILFFGAFRIIRAKKRRAEYEIKKN
jgi:hypothetical protein